MFIKIYIWDSEHLSCMPLAVTFYSLTAVWRSTYSWSALLESSSWLCWFWGFFFTTSSTALKSPSNNWSAALQKYLHTRIEKPTLSLLSESYGSYTVAGFTVKKKTQNNTINLTSLTNKILIDLIIINIIGITLGVIFLGVDPGLIALLRISN